MSPQFKIGDLVRRKRQPGEPPSPMPEADASLKVGRVVGPPTLYKRLEGAFYEVDFGGLRVEIDGSELEPADAVTQLGDLVDPEPG